MATAAQPDQFRLSAGVPRVVSLREAMLRRADDPSAPGTALRAPNGQPFDHAFIASTEQVATDGGIIKVGAWNLAKMRRRWISNHDIYSSRLDQIVLGSIAHAAIESGIDPKRAPGGKALVEYVKYASTEFAQNVKTLFDEGALDEVSVRWDPRTEVVRAPYEQEVMANPGLQWVAEYVEQLELSAVIIAADAGATKRSTRPTPMVNPRVLEAFERVREHGASKALPALESFIRRIDFATRIATAIDTHVEAEVARARTPGQAAPSTERVADLVAAQIAAGAGDSTRPEDQQTARDAGVVDTTASPANATPGDAMDQECRGCGQMGARNLMCRACMDETKVSVPVQRTGAMTAEAGTGGSLLVGVPTEKRISYEAVHPMPDAAGNPVPSAVTTPNDTALEEGKVRTAKCSRCMRDASPADLTAFCDECYSNAQTVNRSAVVDGDGATTRAKQDAPPADQADQGEADPEDAADGGDDEAAEGDTTDEGDNAISSANHAKTATANALDASQAANEDPSQTSHVAAQSAHATAALISKHAFQVSGDNQLAANALMHEQHAAMHAMLAAQYPEPEVTENDGQDDESMARAADAGEATRYNDNHDPKTGQFSSGGGGGGGDVGTAGGGSGKPPKDAKTFAEATGNDTPAVQAKVSEYIAANQKASLASMQAKKLSDAGDAGAAAAHEAAQQAHLTASEKADAVQLAATGPFKQMYQGITKNHVGIASDHGKAAGKGRPPAAKAAKDAADAHKTALALSNKADVAFTSHDHAAAEQAAKVAAAKYKTAYEASGNAAYKKAAAMHEKKAAYHKEAKGVAYENGRAVAVDVDGNAATRDAATIVAVQEDEDAAAAMALGIIPKVERPLNQVVPKAPNDPNADPDGDLDADLDEGALPQVNLIQEPREYADFSAMPEGTHLLAQGGSVKIGNVTIQAAKPGMGAAVGVPMNGGYGSPGQRDEPAPRSILELVARARGMDVGAAQDVLMAIFATLDALDAVLSAVGPVREQLDGNFAELRNLMTAQIQAPGDAVSAIDKAMGGDGNVPTNKPGGDQSEEQVAADAQAATEGGQQTPPKNLTVAKGEGANKQDETQDQSGAATQPTPEQAQSDQKQAANQPAPGDSKPKAKAPPTDSSASTDNTDNTDDGDGSDTEGDGEDQSDQNDQSDQSNGKKKPFGGKKAPPFGGKNNKSKAKAGAGAGDSGKPPWLRIDTALLSEFGLTVEQGTPAPDDILLSGDWARNSATPAEKQAAVAEYGDVKFADPKNKKYPIDSKEHTKSAWSYINMPKNAEKYSAEDLAAVKAKIKTAADKFGIELSERGASIERLPRGTVAYYGTDEQIRAAEADIEAATGDGQIRFDAAVFAPEPVAPVLAIDLNALLAK